MQVVCIVLYYYNVGTMVYNEYECYVGLQTNTCYARSVVSLSPVLFFFCLFRAGETSWAVCNQREEVQKGR